MVSSTENSFYPMVITLKRRYMETAWLFKILPRCRTIGEKAVIEIRAITGANHDYWERKMIKTSGLERFGKRGPVAVIFTNHDAPALIRVADFNVPAHPRGYIERRKWDVTRKASRGPGRSNTCTRCTRLIVIPMSSGYWRTNKLRRCSRWISGLPARRWWSLARCYFVRLEEYVRQ